MGIYGKPKVWSPDHVVLTEVLSKPLTPVNSKKPFGTSLADATKTK